MATVKLRYESWQNINFRGEVDTGIEREEWDEMTPAEQDGEISERLHQLVEISVKED